MDSNSQQVVGEGERGKLEQPYTRKWIATLRSGGRRREREVGTAVYAKMDSNSQREE
ncbi:unnamed protein product [Dovyalis caffra]|uniref:Uncharacterized protein n=1 Tax=Dovyalis caffra TaxID=77055 RepID=A0AAV1RKK5_9ROSI|nr:unnamed protein product [Dovyalis caffra]